MSRAALSLAVLCRAALAVLPPSTDKQNVQIVNKSLEFVNIIKDDLRRDNDDYSMFEQNDLQAGEQPPLPVRRSEPLPAPPPPPLNPNRIPSVPPSTSPPPAPRAPPLAMPPKLPDTRRGMNVTRNLTALMSGRLPNSVRFKSKVNAKHYKKVPVDKLKRLVDRNRMRPVARTAAPPASPAPAPLSAAPRAAAAPHTPPPPLTTTRRPHRQREPAAPREHAGLRSAPAAASSPSPDQLDMAPARGPLITQIRFKGRLCQRSVMRVEGPIYDRLGKTVRPAFRADKQGRQFHQTPAPKFLLPRCCNCCKKSVLGCQ